MVISVTVINTQAKLKEELQRGVRLGKEPVSP
jgi:hypothetical protein